MIRLSNWLQVNEYRQAGTGLEDTGAQVLCILYAMPRKMFIFFSTLGGEFPDRQQSNSSSVSTDICMQRILSTALMSVSCLKYTF